MASNDILLSLQCNTLHLDRIKDTLELSRHRGMIKKKPLSAHSRECHVNIERQKNKINQSLCSEIACSSLSLVMYELTPTHTLARPLNCQLNPKITLAS